MYKYIDVGTTGNLARVQAFTIPVPVGGTRNQGSTVYELKWNQAENPECQLSQYTTVSKFTEVYYTKYGQLSTWRNIPQSVPFLFRRLTNKDGKPIQEVAGQPLSHLILRHIVARWGQSTEELLSPIEITTGCAIEYHWVLWPEAEPLSAWNN